MLYNRASADSQGRPWSERKRLVWWDDDQKRWDSHDVVDFEPDKRPDYRADWSACPVGMEAIGGAEPFIMMPDGRAMIFCPSGLMDGPLPAHYEPVESPVENALYVQQSSPVARKWERDGNRLHEVADPRYPHVLTTYRLTEHHCGGTPTRSIPHTAELQPEGFAEIPPELAGELSIANFDWIVIATARGEIETRALVTKRLRPFQLDGRHVYQIAMPWHFGWQGEVSSRARPRPNSRGAISAGRSRAGSNRDRDMDQLCRKQAETAVKGFDAAIAQGPKVKHEQIAAAVRCLIALRNPMLDRLRAGHIEPALLARVNALVSLAHGAEHPLIGVHLHRMEQARDGLPSLLSAD